MFEGAHQSHESGHVGLSVSPDVGDSDSMFQHLVLFLVNTWPQQTLPLGKLSVLKAVT